MCKNGLLSRLDSISIATSHAQTLILSPWDFLLLREHSTPYMYPHLIGILSPVATSCTITVNSGPDGAFLYSFSAPPPFTPVSARVALAFSPIFYSFSLLRRCKALAALSSRAFRLSTMLTTHFKDKIHLQVCIFI